MDAKNWNSHIASLANPHLLQTMEWGKVKEEFGWGLHNKLWYSEDGEVVAAALILERDLSLGGISRVRMMYVPKGPLLKSWEDKALRQRVLSDLKSIALERRAFFIKIDPDVRVGCGVPDTPGAVVLQEGEVVEEDLRIKGWMYSGGQVQFRNTIIIDLTPPEDELLVRMKQKTRYNVRLSSRRGVTVRVGSLDDLDILYTMYANTSIRDGFVIRERNYYRTVWELFYNAGMLKPLVAEVNQEPVAGLLLFIFKRQAWYLYGMSTDVHREKMPNYLLQWEAMRIAKKEGCSQYDLWGAPESFEENDPLWGVYKFKRGLGGIVVRHLGAWDLPVRPWMYHLYDRVLPKVLDIMRSRGQARTRHEFRGGV
jgi:lipid II:glycine glycyltransferase (peptidoglycan interpeptide bridge formation enzyme)